MKAKILIAAALAAALPGTAQAGAPQVEQGLSFLVGEWTIAGFEGRYTDSCAWFEDRAFVVCNTMDGRRGGKPQRHVAALGWSAERGNYTYLGYAQDGSSKYMDCFANALKGLTCLDESRGSAGVTQLRTHIWPTATGLGLRQEKSVNGGPWSDVGQVESIPKK